MGSHLGAMSLAGRTFVLVALAVALGALLPQPWRRFRARTESSRSRARATGSRPRATSSRWAPTAAPRPGSRRFNGDELYPAWSPDGARIAFQQDPGLHPEIWTSKADGTDLRRLTNNSADDLHPAWSPDGTKIVFASDRADPRRQPLRPVRDEAADGSGAVNITNTPTIDEDYPAWSPDGTKIAFSRDGDIATVAPNGTGLVIADRHRAHRDRAGLVAQRHPARVPHRHQLRRRDLQDERQRHGRHEPHQHRAQRRGAPGVVPGGRQDRVRQGRLHGRRGVDDEPRRHGPGAGSRRTPSSTHSRTGSRFSPATRGRSGRRRSSPLWCRPTRPARARTALTARRSRTLPATRPS